ncbi:hypothetical protein ASZ90_010363 [hydrocarbon metagenome]|uniref:Uncharacterized protein n=1 Tax=hydrocarbon metagenome TaxID=938273 RepID=A0A0W8FG83_9ZZZZ
MRKQGFLSELFREGKIRLVEPSIQIEACRKKSESYLTSA